MEEQWPILSYEKGKSTFNTLHMFTQIVGKIKLATLPWLNHSWNVTLHITPTGLTTQSIPYQGQNLQIDFDFIDHQLKIICTQKATRSFDLYGISVADFYEKIFELMDEMGIRLTIRPIPSEIENPIRFNEDTIHYTYDKQQVTAFHKALLNIHNIFMQFRCGFKGKSSPIHFFWGSFDLALSFFSGRRAPKHPGGIVGLPDWVAEEAYCREVSSCGFWTGNDVLPEAAFYCYLYPAPEGYNIAKIEPDEAYFNQALGEFILPYSAVQQSNNPDQCLKDFLISTYQIGADLAQWDRDLLEN